MNTKQTAQQLCLAAEILETGHPWEMRHEDASVWHKGRTDVIRAVIHKWFIRLALATPPDNRPLHNPANLTAEQVGAGWRLLLEEEIDGKHKGKCQVFGSHGRWSREPAEGTCKDFSYRVPLSVPWPALPDSHVDDKVISYGRIGDDNSIKPEPTFQLPPPPPGMQCPLTFTHLGKTWTYHRPGDPMPCDADALIEIMLEEGRTLDLHGEPLFPRRARSNAWERTIGWRYADEPKPSVPLGPEDVPPGSVFRRDDWKPHSFRMVVALHERGVCLGSGYGDGVVERSYVDLQNASYKINRSIPLTGKWNPAAWEPCHKPG